MNLRPGMTIAICTRNRLDDIARCIASIRAQTIDFPLETLIVDDGEMPAAMLAEFDAAMASRGIALRYLAKREPGLLLSRIEAVRAAAYERLLFLDDDTELEEGYLQRLSGLYDRYPDAAGFGGLDSSLDGGISFLWRWFSRLTLYASRHPGKLSPGGFGGSMILWRKRREPFRTEYVSGCNMSFRISALQDLQPLDWLSGYSLGEDLYLSHAAGRCGPLMIDPGLRVKHRQSPASRDREGQVAYAEVVNHYRLLLLKNARAWRIAALLWTAAGLCVRSFLKKELRRKTTGYRQGIRSVLTCEFRRLFHEGVVDLGHSRRAAR